jgi:predicted hotdog family 3-hydroxylacyl-ACP dehydratase
MKNVPFPVDAAGLMPHQRPMLAIDSILSANPDAALIALRAPPNAWYMKADGTWDEIAGVELIAQAAAAFSGLTQPEGAAPAVGFLAEVREYRVEGAISAGDSILIDVRKKTEFGSFVVVEGRMRRGDDPIATAELTFWLESPGRQGRANASGGTERQQND